MSNALGLRKEVIEYYQNKLTNHEISEEDFGFIQRIINKCDNILDLQRFRTIINVYNRTGLYFRPIFDEKLTNKISYLKKNKDLSFVAPASLSLSEQYKNEHKLIIGDNFPILLNLLITHRNQIDIIYIDPPYGANSMGEAATVTYENKKLTRDHLLSMLKIRLEIAKLLLKDTGAIFCSIDDKNQAYVKCLFDEVFQEKNFVSNLIWVKKHGPGGNTSANDSIVTNTEYVLVYAKNIKLLNISILKHNQKRLKDLGYIYEDKYLNERGRYKLTPLFHPSSNGSFQYIKSLDYEIKAPDGTMFSLHVNKGKNKRAGCYTWSYSAYKAGDELGFIECHKNNDGDWIAYRKQYEKVKFNPRTRKVEQKDAGQPYENIINDLESTYIDDYYSAEGGKDFVNILVDKNIFNFPKPVRLIMHLLAMIDNNDAVILDFFAGSGTTGEAVMQLNRLDQGNRKFILATNNENNIAYKVTYERLKRIMTGKSTSGEKFKWLEKNKPFINDSLSVYEVNFINNNDQNIFNAINENDYGMNSMSLKDKVNWICQNFKDTQKKLEENND